MIITTQDHVVATERQQELAALVPDVFIQTIDADHDAVFARADQFVPMLVKACSNVAERSNNSASQDFSS
jgi:hypothetical protein